MKWLLDHLLRQCIVVGRMTVRWPDQSVTTYAGEPGPEALFALRDRATVGRLALNPALALGEAYMDGGLDPVDCTIHDVLDVLMTNRSSANFSSQVVAFRQGLLHLKRRVAQFNPASRARRNVAHHYDLNGRLYSLFLDRDRHNTHAILNFRVCV